MERLDWQKQADEKKEREQAREQAFDDILNTIQKFANGKASLEVQAFANGRAVYRIRQDV